MTQWTREDMVKSILRIKGEIEAKRPAMERELAEVSRCWSHPNEDEDADYDVRTGVDVLRCADCGERGERTGHMTCQYPQDHT